MVSICSCFVVLTAPRFTTEQVDAFSIFEIFFLCLCEMISQPLMPRKRKDVTVLNRKCVNNCQLCWLAGSFVVEYPPVYWRLCVCWHICYERVLHRLIWQIFNAVTKKSKYPWYAGEITLKRSTFSLFQIIKHIRIPVQSHRVSFFFYIKLRKIVATMRYGRNVK